MMTRPGLLTHLVVPSSPPPSMLKSYQNNAQQHPQLLVIFHRTVDMFILFLMVDRPVYSVAISVLVENQAAACPQSTAHTHPDLAHQDSDTVTTTSTSSPHHQHLATPFK